MVEDHAMNRDMITRRPTSLGYDVIVAVDGEQAVDSATRKAPDLILMDLGLPGIDGWEATRMIRDRETDSHVPIIALTAQVAYDRTHLIQAGCDEFETKPIDMDRLIDKIEWLTSGDA
ncbi:MAG: response regulator [Gammaproteobacteria bacterium]|nr:response regulator [Gammaproteobacteria bacterium]